MKSHPRSADHSPLDRPFRAVILFSELVCVSPAEVLATAATEYPWFRSLARCTEVSDTQADFGIAGIMTFDRSETPLDEDFSPAVERAGSTFPDAAVAVAGHRCAVTVTFGAPGGERRDRIDAALAVSAVAAVLAGLPQCVAVLFPSGTALVTPEEWRTDIADVSTGSTPWTCWITMMAGYQSVPPDGREMPMCASDGIAAFVGTEVIVRAAPVEPLHILQIAHGVVLRLLDHDDPVRDGERLEIVGPCGESSVLLRFRSAEIGWADGWSDVRALGTWNAFHEDCPFDPEDIAGPDPGRPWLDA